MTDLNRFYTQLANDYSLALARLKKIELLVSATRLFVFAGLLYTLYSAFANRQPTLIYLLIVLIALFLWLVQYSSRLAARRQFNQNLLAINQNELNLLQGKANRFHYGDPFAHRADHSDDLDIFGEGSLYALVNRASTSQGTQSLAGIFREPLLEPTKIIDQQQAIKILTPANDLRQDIIASSMEANDELMPNHELLAWVEEPGRLTNKTWWKIIRLALPVINLFTLLLSLQIQQYYPVTLSIVASWIVVGSISRYTNRQNVLLGKKQQQLQAYAQVLQAFNKAQVEGSIVLTNLQNATRQASTEIYRLAQLVNLLDQRMNAVVNFILNSFILYDVQCIIALEKWKLHNKANIKHWIEHIGTIEQLVSLSTYAFNHPQNTYPTVAHQLGLEATGLYHPLIPLQEGVSNDLTIGSHSKLHLITGSNMSGKTTWLRTVGINTLMAQCGLPVCAAAFSFYPVRIYSSIRISDSLQEHTSYFMAELKRLKTIIDQIKTMQPSLVLIDEILRGTNSDDKYFGSEAFVKKLLGFNALSLFATHDLKLSELEKTYPGQVANYCFESTITEGELSFDYKILRGVAKNKNATFLMEKMDII